VARTRSSQFGGIAFLTVSLFAANLVAQPSVPDAGVPEADDQVYALVQSGNTVYVGGRFTAIGGVPRNRLAAFDATTGAVDPNWDPDIGGGTDPFVLALVIEGDRIHVGGRFTTVNGGIARNNLAAFELAGGGNTDQVDAAWDPNVADRVYALVSTGALIYAGGDFNFVNGGTARNSLAAFTPADGINAGIADAWDPDAGVSGSVHSLCIDGGTMYVGGRFGSMGGTPRNRLAAIDLATGTADAAWDPSVSADFVLTLAVAGSRLYAGGLFTTVNGGVARNGLAAFELANGVNTGAVDSSWDPDLSGGLEIIYSLLITGSRVHIGGDFTTVGGTTTRNSAAIFSLADGVNPPVLDPWDPSFTEGVGISAAMTSVNAFLPSGANGLFAGGNFTKVGGVAHNFLVGFGSTVGGVTAVRRAELYR
jgi:hypothetical protein